MRGQKSFMGPLSPCLAFEKVPDLHPGPCRTHAYANNGLDFERADDANSHIRVPFFTAATLPAKL